MGKSLGTYADQTAELDLLLAEHGYDLGEFYDCLDDNSKETLVLKMNEYLAGEVPFDEREGDGDLRVVAVHDDESGDGYVWEFELVD